jgi:hypothetical protein
MTTAADIYAAHADALASQNARIYGPPVQDDIWSGPTAAQFRFDPHRQLDANLSVMASYVEPDDVLIDVGGGAGRVSLPLSLRCREVVNVEPSPGMAAEFASLTEESRIKNARLVAANWLEAEGIQGEVVTTSDVTYFVRDIVPFIEKMETAARRRVMITVWSEPPPNRGAGLFRRVYGEERAPRCGHRQLLPVLWELGILPDVLVLPELSWWETWSVPTREEALELALAGSWLRDEDRERARALFEAQFDELFSRNAQGFRPLWRSEMRDLLITWESRSRA